MTVAEDFGLLLRKWRRTRGTSQLDLALACGMSQRHLSFLESGRSRPSRAAVLNLASALDVPLPQQNEMLLSAGFAPAFRERAMDAPDMRPVEQAIAYVLRKQEPFPAMLVDGAYTIRAANAGFASLLGFLLGNAPATVDAPAVVDMVFSDTCLKPYIENWGEVAAWLIRRLRAEALLEDGDQRLRSILERAAMLTDLTGLMRAAQEVDLAPTLVLRFRKGYTRLALFSMITTVGTPFDLSLKDLRLELFFPADDATAEWFGAQAESSTTGSEKGSITM